MNPKVSIGRCWVGLMLMLALVACSDRGSREAVATCHFAGENQPLICGSKSPTPEALVSYQVCCADQARS
jgi:hypothetical protein